MNLKQVSLDDMVTNFHKRKIESKLSEMVDVRHQYVALATPYLIDEFNRRATEVVASNHAHSQSLGLQGLRLMKQEVKDAVLRAVGCLDVDEIWLPRCDVKPGGGMEAGARAVPVFTAALEAGMCKAFGCLGELLAKYNFVIIGFDGPWRGDTSKGVTYGGQIVVPTDIDEVGQKYKQVLREYCELLGDLADAEERRQRLEALNLWNRA